MVAVRMKIMEKVMATTRRQFQAVAAKFATPLAVTKPPSQIYSCSELQLRIPNSRTREVYLSFFFIYFFTPISIFYADWNLGAGVFLNFSHISFGGAKRLQRETLSSPAAEEFRRTLTSQQVGG